MEDLKKNFILLSKVAKEKKYAQEYLGLLARRGDIGSIRIGKRWYTTWQWFEEFLKSNQKKSSISVIEAPVATSVKTETIEQKETASVKIFREASPVALEPAKANPIKICLPRERKKEPVYAATPAEEHVLSINQPEEKETARARQSKRIFQEPAKISIAVKTKGSEAIGRKNITVGMGDIRGTQKMAEKKEEKMQPIQTKAPIFFSQQRVSRFSPGEFRNASVEKRNKQALPYPEVKLRKNTSVFSPDLLPEEKKSGSLFENFVFATSFALMILLVVASGYFVSSAVPSAGEVAGASDERNGRVSSISSEGEYFLESANGKIKQSLSVSRLIVEMAKEKTKGNDQ